MGEDSYLYVIKYIKSDKSSLNEIKLILRETLKLNESRLDDFLKGISVFKPISGAKVDAILGLLRKKGIICEKIRFQERRSEESVYQARIKELEDENIQLHLTIAEIKNKTSAEDFTEKVKVEKTKSVSTFPCSRCGNGVLSSDKFCPVCGSLCQIHKLTGKKNSVAIILAFLLGGAGAHKFYMGHIGLGIFYLLFFWTFIPAIVACVEAIIYMFDSDESFEKRVSLDLRLGAKL